MCVWCTVAGPANPQSVIGQLATNNAVGSYVWSICLQPGAVSNGTITIGGIDDRLRSGPVTYTPNTGTRLGSENGCYVFVF